MIVDDARTMTAQSASEGKVSVRAHWQRRWVQPFLAPVLSTVAPVYKSYIIAEYRLSAVSDRRPTLPKRNIIFARQFGQIYAFVMVVLRFVVVALYNRTAKQMCIIGDGTNVYPSHPSPRHRDGYT